MKIKSNINQMLLTNNSIMDDFVDDDYQSKEFIKKQGRERDSKPIASFDILGKNIKDDPNINPLFKNLFK